jgi:uncharacterized protein with NAD-binding domain and iron-sulfur cluster
MHGSVVIVGGGIAGLTAAHELVERGFPVTVYERRPYFGGKAASYRKERKINPRTPAAPPPAPCANPRPNAALSDEQAGLPGEHGFRFFPGWYRHLTDTMARIPYHEVGGGRRSVADNLVSVETNLLAWFDRSPVALPLHVPRSAADVATTSELLAELGRLGLSPDEIALFWRKLLEVAAMSDERRAEALEGVSWWQYLECDAPERSRAYRDLVRATTRTSVAARAEEVSAYTIGRLAIRSLLDMVSEVDRVLNGPTNEVWIDRWIDHLKARGVKFVCEMELRSIEFSAEERRVEKLTFEPVAAATARRIRQLLEQEIGSKTGQAPDGADGPEQGAEPDEEAEPAQVVEFDSLMSELRRSAWLETHHRSDRAVWETESSLVRQHLKDCGHLREEAESDPTKLRALLRARKVLGTTSATLRWILSRFEDERGTETTPDDTAYFVLSLPLEQLAYYVDRSTMWTFLAPEMRNIIRLSRHMDWMAGIQFYLRQPLDVSPGHIIGLDSSWALTAIEQTQFWREIVLPPDVAAVLSVDISVWDEKGRFTRKEAFNCSNEEIAREVWRELREMLNKPDRGDVLTDGMLVGGQRLVQGVNFHLDDNVIDLWDRKKQAFYERARGVEFDTLELIDQNADDTQWDAAGKTDSAFAWGPKRRFNAEPLLLNRPGSRALRPEAATSIPNLFLAGDYVKTETDLACMEGANEAARRAVNAILDAEAAKEARCELWSFSPPRQAVEAALSVGGLLKPLRDITSVAAQLQNQFWKKLAFGMMRIQGSRAPALGQAATTALSKRD